MKLRPDVVAFDVLETLFSLEPMRAKLIGLGLPAEALELWFARLLRNAFALDASGTFKPGGFNKGKGSGIEMSHCMGSPLD